MATQFGLKLMTFLMVTWNRFSGVMLTQCCMIFKEVYLFLPAEVTSNTL